MLDTFKLYNDLKQTMDEKAAETIVQVLGTVYDELRDTVAKAEFNEIREVIHDLAEAQKRTEERVEELAQAQKRTEERVEELAQAQKRTEEKLEQLAQAQARTEQRVEELAQAQARTEQRVEELAQAQARTEEKVEELSVGLRELQKAVTLLARQVGGLSDAVGGDIEDIAYIVLHDVLQREYGWKVGVLERTWQNWGREPEEVNIFGQATDPARPGEPIWIVGEAKHNLTQSDVSRFVRQLERARQNLSGEIFPVCFCYRARPEVREQIAEAGVRLIFSYGRLV